MPVTAEPYYHNFIQDNHINEPYATSILHINLSKFALLDFSFFGLCGERALLATLVLHPTEWHHSLLALQLLGRMESTL